MTTLSNIPLPIRAAAQAAIAAMAQGDPVAAARNAAACAAMVRETQKQAPSR